MTDESNPPPRFVPTLTEVIGAQQAPSATPPAMAEQPASTALAPTSAEALLAQIGPDLDRLIAEAVGRVLHEQMLGFNARAQKAVAEVVRDSVVRAHLSGLAADRRP